MVQHADIDHTGLTGVGGALTIEDEGTPLATGATTLDFVGAGVTASGTGAEKTITIPGGGGSYWDQIIEKASNDTVTNSATLTADSELTWSVGGVAEVWEFEATIIYTSDATGDYKCDLAASAGNFDATFAYLGSDTTSNAVLVSTGVRNVDVTDLTDIAAGGGGGTANRILMIRGALYDFSSACTVSFRFAQNTQTPGQSAVTKIGSTLRVRKLV